MRRTACRAASDSHSGVFAGGAPHFDADDDVTTHTAGCLPSGSRKLQIRGLGCELQFIVSEQETIYSLKHKLAPLASLPAAELQLLCKGASAPDSALVSVIVADGAELRLVRRYDASIAEATAAAAHAATLAEPSALATSDVDSGMMPHGGLSSDAVGSVPKRAKSHHGGITPFQVWGPSAPPSPPCTPLAVDHPPLRATLRKAFSSKHIHTCAPPTMVVSVAAATLSMVLLRLALVYKWRATMWAPSSWRGRRPHRGAHVLGRRCEDG